MTEAYTSMESIVKYFGRVENGEIVEFGSHIPFNFLMMGADISTKAIEFKKAITEFLTKMPNGNQIHANWVVSISNA